MRLVAAYALPRPARASVSWLLALGVATLFVLLFAALAFVVYVMWPRWPEPPISAEAPPLPIVVADVVFQVPQSAIRQKVQRRPGAHDRLDIVYLWPQLTPAAVLSPDDPKRPHPAAERIFVTIASAPAALTPAERLKGLYPRYAESGMTEGPAELTELAFRNGTPYQGEDVLFDPNSPDRFLARCTRNNAKVHGTCLYERLLGSASMMVRFPRGWLERWREIVGGTDRLIEQLRPSTMR